MGRDRPKSFEETSEKPDSYTEINSYSVIKYLNRYLNLRKTDILDRLSSAEGK
jgi:hypothetical protein